MKAIQLYKFIENNDIEWHYRDNEGARDVICFINFYHLKEFINLIKISHLYDGFIDCVLADGYIAIWMGQICDYYDIEMKEVFEDNDKND